MYKPSVFICTYPASTASEIAQSILDSMKVTSSRFIFVSNVKFNFSIFSSGLELALPATIRNTLTFTAIHAKAISSRQREGEESDECTTAEMEKKNVNETQDRVSKEKKKRWIIITLFLSVTPFLARRL